MTTPDTVSFGYVEVPAGDKTAMVGEVTGYFRNFSDQWLLAVMGGLILVLDVWIILEGLRMLVAEREPKTAGTPRSGA